MNTTHKRLRLLLGAAALALLASCGGGGTVDSAGDAPGQPVAASPQSIDRDLSGCRSMLAGGLPPALVPSTDLRGLCFEAFAVVHDGAARGPKVVLQVMDRASVAAAESTPRTGDFYEEARLPAAERSRLSDYAGSGFDRGHMAPAGDMPSPSASAQSFSLSNVVPQNPTQNSGAWRRIEDDTRRYVQRAQGPVYVATGVVHDASGQTVGAGRVKVPVALFKLVYDPLARRSWAHWQPNAASAVAGPPITREELLLRLAYDPMPGAISQ